MEIPIVERRHAPCSWDDPTLQVRTTMARMLLSFALVSALAGSAQAKPPMVVNTNSTWSNFTTGGARSPVLGLRIHGDLQTGQLVLPSRPGLKAEVLHLSNPQKGRGGSLIFEAHSPTRVNDATRVKLGGVTEHDGKITFTKIEIQE